ncbi:MAG: IS4 family transposase, partial [Deltaproteobacteria bacterium]|nr:IS4 family transposase [Deltaproteobacteria bacterium]
MWLHGQWFGPDVLARIAATVEAEPTLSRRALSRRVCDWLGWRSPTGRPCEVGCRKALLELERRGHVKLPACARVAGFDPARTRKKPTTSVAEVCCSLEELGEVEIVPVTSRYCRASRVWNDLMAAHHYLGAGPLCGAQMRYLVRSPVHGWLGALSFSGATKRVKARDAWIGWSERARREHLPEVVCNSRFLICPSVQVRNLASHVLALSTKRLARDWSARYGYEPVLVETFVDGELFAGTCYRAANWVPVGRTAGRGDGYANGTVSTGPKDVYVYPLREDWRSELCLEPPDRLVLRTLPHEPAAWVEEEFAGALVYDGRLRRRLHTVVRDFFAQPGAPIAQACWGSLAKSKGVCRFFDNERIDLQGVLRGHVEATAQRIGHHEVVLAVQDTTTLNYCAHPATEGLGPINTKAKPGRGLIVHSTMAFSVEGTPLGLLDVQSWARDPKEAGKKAKRNRLPIEAKESVKWVRSYRAVAEVQRLCPRTRVVSVGDRESDLHELFHEAEQTRSGPELLVRAERARRRCVVGDEADETALLWDRLSAEPVAGHQVLVVPRQGSRPRRTATLSVRYAQVRLKPPGRRPQQPVRVWAVYAREEDPPADVASPLEWMLLTTVEVSSFEQAIERLHWYTLRWGIEVYHRVLKSGCRIEDRQLDTSGRIENCLA